jgi:MFS transporter, UMF1 family
MSKGALLRPGVQKRELFGWAMFDFANSSYTTVVITALYSGFFVSHVVPEGATGRDSYWSLAMILSTVIALLLSPLVGAICDFSGRKKLYLTIAAIFCSVFTALLFFVGPGMIFWGVLLVALSNACFMLSETFCGGFLPDIATEESMGKVSGLGWGLGYFGGLASLLLVFSLVGGSDTQSVEAYVSKNQLGMVLTGGFFLLAALPTFLFVKDRQKPKPGFENASFGKLLKAGFLEMKNALQTVRNNALLFRFFLAFVVYMAGIDAVIKFVGIYAKGELGFQTSDLTIMFLILQLSAAGGAFGFGYLEGKLGPKNTVMATLFWWMVAIAGIYSLPTLAAWLSLEPKNVFFGIALLAGAGIGATQSSSRAIVGILAPPDKISEMFGFWGFFMRISTILGMSFGFLSDALESRRLALLLVLGFFAVGALMLSRVPMNELKPTKLN